MKRYFIVMMMIIIGPMMMAQVIIDPSPIKWYTLEQAMKLSETNPRPVMLDVYTEWCSWCKFMMTTTFANRGLAEYINNNFYAAKLNAETFDTLTFKGQKYINRRIGNRPSHDLAAVLLNGQLSYPSLVFIDRDGNRTVIPGYKEAKDLEPILIYFVESVNKSASLDDFYVNFMYTFPKAFKEDHSIFKIDDKLKPDTLGSVNWIKPQDLALLQKKKPKQVGIFFYTDWNISSKVMEKTSFRNREITSILNEKFYMVKINAASADTINFLGKKFAGTGVNLPNQLAYAYLNSNFQMPAVVILDEKNTVKGMINGFWAKNQLLPLFNYFYTNANKNLTFQEYIKTYSNTQ